MPVYADSVLAAMANAFESDVGPSPIFRLYGDAPTAPATLTDALGTLVAEAQAQADWLGDYTNSLSAINGVLRDAAADVNATAIQTVVIFASDGTTKKALYTIGLTGSGKDLERASLDVTQGQPVDFSGINFSFS